MGLKLFGQNFKKEELLKRVGDISQIGGIRSFEFNDGLRKGVRGVDFISPNGLFFTALPDRALDISFISYKGVPLCWRSATKEASAMYFEYRESEWLRTFFGGLLVTCGLTQVGDPCEDDGEKLGLHGRITNIAAENVLADEEWLEEDYIMWVQGKIKEVSSLGDKLVLKRKISTKFSKPEILIEDEIENIGNKKCAFMILYHINFGFPLLDKDSKLIMGKANTFTKFNEESNKESNIKAINNCGKPTKGFVDQVYLHDIEPDDTGYCNVAFINPNLSYYSEDSSENGMGVGISFLKESLPYLTQWKKFDEIEYVTGIEPSNCFVRGRAIEKKDGKIRYIEPGQKIKTVLKITILENNKEIENFTKLIRK